MFLFGMYANTHNTCMFKNIKNAIQSHSKARFGNIYLKTFTFYVASANNFNLGIYLNKTVVG